ncbi:hypothetical protein EBT31_16690 [bacterium]|nr:hypothetical protein [bacterium]
MFILQGKPLALDRAFTHDGISYPANWLRSASPAEREAIGVTEAPDPAVYDQRFYWGYDADGNLIPKDHAQLVEQWVSQTRTTANTLLQPSDWMVIREADNGAEVPLEVKAYRQLVREKCGEKVAAIEATTSTDELAAYITGAEYSAWSEPEAPAA